MSESRRRRSSRPRRRRKRLYSEEEVGSVKKEVKSSESLLWTLFSSLFTFMLALGKVLLIALQQGASFAKWLASFRTKHVPKKGPTDYIISDAGSVSTPSLDLDSYVAEQDDDLDLASMNEATEKVKTELSYIRKRLLPLLIPVAIPLGVIYIISPKKLFASIASLFSGLWFKLRFHLQTKTDFITEQDWYKEKVLIAFYLKDIDEVQVLTHSQAALALYLIHKDLQKHFRLFSLPRPEKSTIKKLLKKVDRLGQNFVTEEEFRLVAGAIFRGIGLSIVSQALGLFLFVPAASVVSNYLLLSMFPFGDTFAVIFGISNAMIWGSLMKKYLLSNKRSKR